MTAITTERLVARSVAISPPPNLVDAAGAEGMLWHDEHGGLVGHGQAVRVELPCGLQDSAAVRRVSEVLSSIECRDEVGLPGCGPVAMGALAFDPAAPGHLVVPRRIIGRRGDQAWLTTVDFTGRGDNPQIDPAGPTGQSPDGFSLSSPLPHAAWQQLIAHAVDAIGEGGLDKVVLARRVDVEANRPFVVPDVLGRLIALYPSCMVFSVEGFIGASPELLIRRLGRHLTSHPLAGTVARSGEPASDDALVAGLLASVKDRQEHQFVVDTLADALRPVCHRLDVPPTPSVVGLRNVSHLGTTITGQLADGDDGRLPTALELVARVHPTPAVAGTPTDEAVKYLQAVEGFDRGRYAGPVGWVDGRGDGAWAIGIRSAELDGPRAALFAGVGVVAGSDPDAELAETQLKLQALLAALVRP